MKWPVQIRVGVKSVQRAIGTRWRESKQTVDNFVLDTDTDNYVPGIETLLTRITAYVSQLQAQTYTDVGVTYQVQFVNINPDQIGKGAYFLPKQQLNGALSTDEFTISLLRDVLQGHVQYLHKLADAQP